MVNNAMAPQLPIYENGELSFDLIEAVSGLGYEDISKIIDVGMTTIRAKGVVSTKTLHKSQDLIYILNMLWKIFEGDRKEMKRWLHEPRIEWYGLSPKTSLIMGKAKAVKNLLERSLEGEISGT